MGKGDVESWEGANRKRQDGVAESVSLSAQAAPSTNSRASEDAEPSIWASGSLVGTEDRLGPKI